MKPAVRPLRQPSKPSRLVWDLTFRGLTNAVDDLDLAFGERTAKDLHAVYQAVKELRTATEFAGRRTLNLPDAANEVTACQGQKARSGRWLGLCVQFSVNINLQCRAVPDASCVAKFSQWAGSQALALNSLITTRFP